MKPITSIASATTLIAIMGISTPAFSDMPPAGESELFYEIGGGMGIPTTIGNGDYVPYQLGINASLFGACGQFDPRYSISQMIDDWESKLTSLGSAFTAMVAGLPGYIFCRSNPLACQLEENITARVEGFYKAGMDTCQEFQEDLVEGGDETKGWLKTIRAETWESEAEDGEDPEESSREVSQANGSDGVVWIGGIRAGGNGQPPLRVVADTVKAGYNLQFHRNVTNGNELVMDDDEAASNSIARYWRTPEEAAKWLTEVVGEIRPNINENEHGALPPGASLGSTSGADGDGGDGGEDVEITHTFLRDDINSPALGLMPKVNKEEEPIKDLIDDYIATGAMPSNDELISVSGSSSSAVITPELLRAIRSSPMRATLSAKLARDIAIANVAQMAMASRRTLIAGYSEPNISGYEPARTQLKYRQDLLDKEIEMLITEKEVTKLLVSDTAVTLLKDYRSRRETRPETPTGQTPFIQGGAVAD